MLHVSWQACNPILSLQQTLSVLKINIFPSLGYFFQAFIAWLFPTTAFSVHSKITVYQELVVRLQNIETLYINTMYCESLAICIKICIYLFSLIVSLCASFFSTIVIWIITCIVKQWSIYIKAVYSTSVYIKMSLPYYALFWLVIGGTTIFSDCSLCKRLSLHPQ